MFWVFVWYNPLQKVGSGTLPHHNLSKHVGTVATINNESERRLGSEDPKASKASSERRGTSKRTISQLAEELPQLH